MVAGVTATIELNIRSSFVGSGDLGAPRMPVNIAELVQLIPGTDAATKANAFFSDTRQLAASTSEDLDLAGTLVDAFGATITAAEIVAIYIKAHTTNTNSVIIGAATAPFAGPLGAEGTYTLKPGEWVAMVSQTGWAVGAGTTDDLKVANSSSGTAVDYDVLIIGRTVAA